MIAALLGVIVGAAVALAGVAVGRRLSSRSTQFLPPPTHRK